MFTLFRSAPLRFVFVFIFRSSSGNPLLPLLSRIVSNPSSSHLTEDPTELARERRESVDAVDIGRREEAFEEAFERTEDGRGVVARLLIAESTESCCCFRQQRRRRLAGALVWAPKLGPTMFAPPINTELAVLPLLTVGRRMVGGSPNPQNTTFLLCHPSHTQMPSSSNGRRGRSKRPHTDRTWNSAQHARLETRPQETQR